VELHVETCYAVYAEVRPVHYHKQRQKRRNNGETRKAMYSVLFTEARIEI
jgi:hypothetical protein